MFAKLFDLLDRALGKEPPAPKPVPRKPAARAAPAPAPSPSKGDPAAAPRRKLVAPGAHVPRVCTNPALFAHEPGVEVWQFQVPDQAHACPAALAMVNQRVGADTALSAPLSQCDRGGECHCNFRLLPDERRGPRRSGEERRELVRFDVKKVDRRKNDGRRKEDGWSGAKP